MDNDSYTEVTRQGWFSRIGESIKGILFGFFLFIAAFPLLWWNEGRSVERYKTLKEGQGLVVSISADIVESANQDKLVHLQGLAVTEEVLNDEEFGVSANAIKLKRNVSMYQWRENVKTETREEVGGTKTTTKTYSYVKQWSQSPINSSQFKKPGYDNPPMLYHSKVLEAKHVTLGDFKLNASQINRIGGENTVSLHSVEMPAQLGGKKVSLVDNNFYLGDFPGEPVIGDLKIGFTQVGDSEISLVAQQLNQSFGPYQTEAGGTIDLLKMGLMDAEAMFAAAHKENTLLTWGIRIGGTLVMWFGLSLIFKPLSVVGSVLPLLGNLLAMGTGIFAFLITLPCALITIALAWVYHRPILAGVLIAIAVAAIIAIKFMPKREPVLAQN